jgi:hypothetical protein
LGALEELHDRYGDRVAFFVVYIKEAHPEDGWVLSDNRDQDIAVADPTSPDERAEVGRACSTRLRIGMPVLVDGLDDEVARQYGGWPDRLYLIGRDGGVAFQGGEGPFGFKPEELEAAIRAELG